MKNLFVCVILLCCTIANGQIIDKIQDDRDGKEYKTVKIGNQWWMAENLNYDTKTGSIIYNNDSKANSPVYGRLYDWNTAVSSCPSGWHLPSHEEWRYLEMELGFKQNEPVYGNNLYGKDEGGKLKEVGLLHWQEPNTGASNTTDFSALPGGHFAMNQFWGINQVGHFWAGEKDAANAWYRSLIYKDSAIHIYFQEKSGGYKSVRCVKDTILLSGEYMGQSIPKKIPKPFGLGIISNFASNEHTCSISPDGKEIYFTRDPDRKTFVVKRNNNEWGRPEPVGFNGREAIFSPDGSKLLFGDGDIWFIEKKGGEWTSPQKFSSCINTAAYEYYASMTLDGILYFSRIENNHPSIFMAKIKNGRYSEAIRLPSQINTNSSSNFHPFISPDEKHLVFNSDRTGGFGGADLYVSFKGANGEWQKPINLGDKINTEVRDICPTITPDGKYLFFTRNWEENGNWYGDIFWVSVDLIKECKKQSPNMKRQTK